MMLSTMILKTGELGLTLQNSDGSMPKGHNGPYNDLETPVRNTAHWLFLFAFLFQKTKDARWKDAGENAINYLSSSDARPSGKTFYCRDTAGKDKCNGLIGQAWVIEALAKAAVAFNQKKYYQFAEEIFLLHPWDSQVGLWQRMEIDGRILFFDDTFNHQLWFAAAGASLRRSPEIQYQVKKFIQKVASSIQLYPNGVIFHSSHMSRLFNYSHRGLRFFSMEAFSRLKKQKMWGELYSKSVGYHAFNLYAFAVLKQYFPNEKIWQSKDFEHIITAHRNKQFQMDLETSGSAFGYYYNISGIEIAYAIEIFYKNNPEAKLWLERQLNMTYVDQSHILTGHATDENTALARMYEAVRLTNDYELQF